MKLLLIGWDTADWALIQQLLDRGMMPRLQHFSSKAVVNELSPVRPFDSAALWTSLVTGKRAMAHGVLTALEVDPSGLGIRPASRWTLTARPVWSVLSAAGYRTHAFGWPASHPAAPLDGVVLSDHFAEGGDQDSIHPPRLVETLRALRLTPAEIDAASLVTLLPRAGELNPVSDQRLYAVAQFLASTASLHAAATWALEHEPWEFAAVRYAGLARLASVFGPAYGAAQAGEPSEEAELFGELLPNAYHFFDMLLGRLLELAGPDASVLLVSPSGWTPPSRAATSDGAALDGARPRPGIFIGAGPAFESTQRGPSGNVCDVAPTILALFGLPPEPGAHGCARHDMIKAGYRIALSRGERPGEGLSKAGNPSSGASERAAIPPLIASQSTTALRSGDFGSPVLGCSQPLEGGGAAPLADDESVSHLLALGYRDRTDEFLVLAIRKLHHERQWRLAEAWIDNREYSPAARVLESLVQAEPRSMRYRSLLAEVSFRAGEHETCRRLILALQADGLDTPLGQIALAALDFLAATGDAVAHLRQAEALGGASARMLEMIARLYLGLRRRADAARVLDAALAMEPALATAHIARAIAYLVTGDPSSAERHARAAAELDGRSYEASFQLGLALAGQNRVDEAIDALRAAVALDGGGGASAHRRLADLLERRGDRALALHHRALVDRRGRATGRPRLDLEWFSDQWSP